MPLHTADGRCVQVLHSPIRVQHLPPGTALNNILHRSARPSPFKTILLVLSAASALAACGARMPGLSGLQTNQLGLPEAIRVPVGNQIALEAHGSGELLYTCQAINRAPFQYAWLLQSSTVRLQDSSGRTINYYPGTRSRWVHSDGSQMVTQESVEAASDNLNLPQQRARAEASGSSGVLGKVNYVQTLRSVGGVVTTKPCVAGNLGMRVTVPVESDYVFWQPSA